MTSFGNGGQKVKVTRLINAETENQLYLWKDTNFKLGIQMVYYGIILRGHII